jgi:antitoxin (DNA-binding transcriptional repressor) of toxin-antitoxin stability system
MILVNIYEAKAKLSEYLDAVAKGERVLICKRNQPIAELRAVGQKRTEPRLIGGGPYHFDVPDSFFEPMPDDFLDTFESGPVFPEATPASSRVAEARPKYKVSRRRPTKRR